jgi:hypothetical protein
MAMPVAAATEPSRCRWLATQRRSVRGDRHGHPPGNTV